MKTITTNLLSICLLLFMTTGLLVAQSPKQPFMMSVQREIVLKTQSNQQQARLVNHFKGGELTVLDSMVFYTNISPSDSTFSHMTKYAYDELGRQTLREEYNWNESTQEWEGKGSRQEVVYTTEGLISQQTLFDWNETSQSWIPYLKESYVYDLQGNETEYIWENWDAGSEAWLPAVKYETEYNTNNQRTQYIEYEWNETTESWDKSYKSVDTYDVTSDSLLREENYFWDSDLNDWVNSSKWEFVLEADGRPLRDSIMGWDSDAGDWTMVSKREYSYNAQNQLTEKLWFDWKSEDWLQKLKTSYQYDENGYEDIVIQYQWDTDDWLEKSKNEYDYQADGLCLMMASYSWDKGSWKGNSKESNAYDGQNNKTQYIEYQWDVFTSDWQAAEKTEKTYNIDNQTETISNYDWNNNLNRWDLVDRTFPVYTTKTIVQLSEDKSLEMSVFPNPVAGNFITVKLNQETISSMVQIVDMTGKVCFNKQVNRQIQFRIDISHLEQGVYILNVETTGGRAVSRLLVH